jgi:hypothetical protein
MQMLVSLTDTSNPAKLAHAALLLLMLEAVHGPRFTISLKRSTQNLQLSTSWAGRLPHLCPWKRTFDIDHYANLECATSHLARSRTFLHDRPFSKEYSGQDLKGLKVGQAMGSLGAPLFSLLTPELDAE